MSYTKTVWRNNQAPAINADNLNHIEQGIESAHNQMAINTSDIETLTTQVQGNASNIASEISARQSGDSSLQSQIDQLVAPTGEAPTPAEIENARISDDGVIYDTLGNAIRGQFSDIKSATNALVEKYKGAKPMTYTINNNRVSIVSAFYTIENNILERIILLRIATNSITSANTWTLGHISNPVAHVGISANAITYNAVSLNGGDISSMTFQQTNGGSGNFQLITTAGVSAGQGGLIMLTHRDALTSTTDTPYKYSQYPQELLNKTLMSIDLFDAFLAYSGYGWHIADAQLKSLSGYSFIQCRVQGGSSIKVSGMSESMSSYGYAIRNSSGTVIASGGESDGMVILHLQKQRYN